jgi:hypothetical protein
MVIFLAVIFLALTLYVLACSSPAVTLRTIGNPSGTGSPAIETLLGWDVLLFGWCPRRTALAWAANILILVSLILLCVGWTRAALTWSSLAVLSSLTTWLFRVSGDLLELHVGYWLWQLSLLLFTLGSWMIHERAQGERADHSSPGARGAG